MLELFFGCFFLPNNDAVATSEAGQTEESFSQGHIPQDVTPGRRMANLPLCFISPL